MPSSTGRSAAHGGNRHRAASACVRAVRWSTALGWIGGLCGLVLSYYLTTAGDFAALSPLYMLAFLALLLLPTLLLSGLVKYY